MESVWISAAADAADDLVCQPCKPSSNKKKRRKEHDPNFHKSHRAADVFEKTATALRSPEAANKTDGKGHNGNAFWQVAAAPSLMADASTNLALTLHHPRPLPIRERSDLLRQSIGHSLAVSTLAHQTPSVIFIHPNLTSHVAISSVDAARCLQHQWILRRDTLPPASYVVVSEPRKVSKSPVQENKPKATFFMSPLDIYKKSLEQTKSIPPPSAATRQVISAASSSATKSSQASDGEWNSLFRLDNNKNYEEDKEKSAAASRPLVAAKTTSRKRQKKTPKDPDQILLLYVPDDREKLNDYQIFLRQQTEYFRATEDDILSITRGKNKPIVLQQVGIRCLHCRHVEPGRRKKGSTYFPSNLMGIYQAVQNMGTEHFQKSWCSEVPPEVKFELIASAMSCKPSANGSGKQYWAQKGAMLGLVDTEDGIRFATDVGRKSHTTRKTVTL